MTAADYPPIRPPMTAADYPPIRPPDGRVRLSIDGPTAVLTLDRPDKLNALTMPMLDDLDHHLGQLEQSDTVRVVIIAGEGHRSFCVGADIEAWGRLASEDPVAMWRIWNRTGNRVLDRLATLPMPVIAAVHGHVLGGGLEVALAADLRIAADDVQLGLPEIGLGTQPGWGASRRLSALVGLGRAKQLALIDRRIDAATALSWGLVNEVVRLEELRTRALALGRHIAGYAPVAVALAKATFDGGGGRDPGSALDGIAGALAASTADGREGPAAYRERRAPNWRGR